MVSASRTAHSIEVTAEGLQEELAWLHFQKQALERELVAIVAHLGSVHVAYFAKVGDAEVRAREVAAALGRDADSGSINAVRSTLDRLVASSRIERAGRGLYRTGRS